jgi:hypothetical protein
VNAGVKPATYAIRSGNANYCVKQAHYKIGLQADMKTKEGKYQQIGNVINPKANEYIDPRLDE